MGFLQKPTENVNMSYITTYHSPISQMFPFGSPNLKSSSDSSNEGQLNKMARVQDNLTTHTKHIP